ncbi:alpha/beta hydrolase [Nocardioides humilatus]|uniref:Alpha/beta hydrolase n=1 Tax=Nocardioides humilatus TaxID=2607660 RepID=A0A5B1LMR4_9ACTN|nr:alpha/beta hydrolase [Nocardioides humilatus]KAA1420919.1 alpha/beta hydrolase [Nocardioides humilatus]
MKQPTLVDAGPVSIAYETFGSPDDPTVVLIAGIATQMLGWPDGFCQGLADEGFQVLRFDNRDVGLSTHFHDAELPQVDLTPGATRTAPYLLGDMADDVAALLDALDLDRVHVVGFSMGGMIAQEVALRHPERVISLTSIMSTPSANVGEPTPEAIAALLSPSAKTVVEASDRAVETYAVVGSPGYPTDEAWLRATAEESYRRSNDPKGVVRQFAAVIASRDRRPGLRELAIPTLVLHGEEDPLIQVDGGHQTAAAVPGARLVTYPGMGHDFPQPLWPAFIGEITDHALRAQKEDR